MAAAAAKARTAKIIFLWPEQLKVAKGFNVRFEMGDITALAKSIVSNGIKEPIRGYNSGEKTTDGLPIYIITDGHRRFTAAQRIADKMEEGDFIPFFEEPKEYTNEDRVVDMLITGENKKPLNLLEAARAVKRLKDAGWKNSEIAARIGKSPTHITDCLILVDRASEENIKSIEDGSMTASSILEMLKINSSEVVEQVVAKGKESAAAKGKTKLKVSELEEESGEALTTKGKKKSTSAKENSVAQAGTEKKEEKVDASLQRLLDLRAVLKAQEAVDKVPGSFELLNALIKIAKGTKMPIDVLDMFIVQEPEVADEAPEEEEEAPVKPAKKAKAEEKKVSKKKTSAAPVEEEPEVEDLAEDLEEEEEEDEDWVE